MDRPLLYVLGQVLPLAVGVSLSPLPVIATVLITLSPQARTSGPAFVVGRMSGLAGVLAGVAAAAEVLYTFASSAGLPPQVKLVLGAALFLLGVTRWRPKPSGAEPALPKWMSALETLRAGRSFGLGFALTIVNPKELALLLAVGLTLGGASLALRDEVLLAVGFVVVASIPLLVPVIAVLIAPRQVSPVLDRVRVWLTENHSVVMGLLLVLIGAIVAGGAISEL